MASAEDDEMIYLGPVTFDEPIPVSAIPEEHEALQAASHVITIIYSGSDETRSLRGIDAVNEDDGWAWSAIWDRIHHTLETLARRYGRTLHTAATFASDGRGHGVLVVDAGNRLHDCQEGEDPEAHRTRTCVCYSWTPPSVEITEHEQVPVPQAVPAGPFIDHIVVCADHGEVVCATSERAAYFRREAHIVAEHTPRPLPLGPRPATEALSARVLEQINEAAQELRRARSYDAGGAISYRDAAREKTRRAEAELSESDLNDTVAALLQLCVELRAELPQ